MDFIRDSIQPLSNYETYLIVKQVHENEKQMRRNADRTFEHNNIGLNTVTYETLKYLENTSCIEQTEEIMKTFYNCVKDKYNLRKLEILQMLNLRPSTPVELQLIIEDSETRLSDQQIDELLNIIVTLLPGKEMMDTQ
ncbi:unnamed protein product [Didymodactylos carnosus]|uniref:DNA-directed RNA polymerase III subunit RPC9 n=1 Tax=Didymodactylos carnosus TaxID=1234261 RepID=A0A813P2Z6_9BILA|nr:unnamed protein product [Didymodactylos carnosus]CAF0748204.1 unnamed protein product [Didymodactylos carnosus]CAF3506821.1 unnamed protein product [Didymodactylos carnosus]CAF3527325.1 unnamed protein product [Didymodactylos carnosus]